MHETYIQIQSSLDVTAGGTLGVIKDHVRYYAFHTSN